MRGIALRRLELSPRLARDCNLATAGYDYFIHMRDAGHPARGLIESVEPEIGRRRNAELRQAAIFGISLDNWLSIQQER